ncbi:MAG: alpha/beta hydrolase [Erythrobacter sp.]
MSRRFRLFIAMLAIAGAAPALADTPEAEAAPVQMPQVSAGTVVAWPDLASAHLALVPDVWVWLPPGYEAQPQRKFPVLYMHDGHNLFDRRLSNFDKEWQVDEAIARMAGRGDLREWIVVAIRAPDARYKTLFPEKLLPHLPADMQQEVLIGEFGSSAGDQALRADEYLAFLVRELKPRVDREFRTLAGPRDTAIMGSSMGGLISLYAIAEYPRVFGQAAGLSTHLPLVDPRSGSAEERSSAVAAAFGKYFASTALSRRHNRIYIDHGTGTLDAFYPPYFKAFDRMMQDGGWAAPEFESRAFFGTEHEENAWAQRLDIPLGFLDRDDP